MGGAPRGAERQNASYPLHPYEISSETLFDYDYEHEHAHEGAGTPGGVSE